VAGRTAVITGAYAGIGAAFACRLAADGYDLVLVARDGERLRAFAAELAAQYGGTVTPVVADLSTDEGRAAVVSYLTAAPVDLLINNAGIGLRRSVLRNTLAEEQHLLQLNVGAVLELTHAVLPSMVERGTGDVINVSSVAAFASIPGSSYPASKAWVVSFSECTDLLVRPRGVRVMALCPGLVRTEFHQRAGIDTADTPPRAWLTADDVAAQALHDLAKGRRVSIPSMRYRLAVWALRLAPRRIAYRLSSTASRRTKRV